ncbi:MAG TPA: c-type cytochrome [Eoetvoesiella sp.]
MYLKIFASLCMVGSALWSAPIAAQTIGPDLVRANNCLACHLIDKKRTGPAFELIARRFADQPEAVDYLAGAIRSGGRGRWGAVPMPAQPQVNPEDAHAIAEWILSLSKNGAR